MDHTNGDDSRQPPGNDKLTRLSVRIKASDHQAFAELFEAMHASLLRYSYRYTGHTEASRDIVQNAFLKLWAIRDSLIPTKSIKSLLYTIVRNLSLNYKRSLRLAGEQLPSQVVDYRIPSPEQIVDGIILDGYLRQCVDELPPKRKQAFVLSRFYEMNHKEIARLMGVKHRTVNTHIVHALRDLKACFAKLGIIRDHED